MKKPGPRELGMIELRSQGWLLPDLGRKYQVTAERIRQILFLYGDEVMKKRFQQARERRRIRQCTRFCSVCKKRFIADYTNSKSIHCSMRCAQRKRSIKIYGKYNPYRKGTTRYNHWRYVMLRKMYPELLRKYWKTRVMKVKNDPILSAKQTRYQRDYWRKKHGSDKLKKEVMCMETSRRR